MKGFSVLVKIEELHIGMRVRYWRTNGAFVDGVIVGKEGDRLKVKLDTITVPPEDTEVVCDPVALEVLRLSP
jgi:hypothetical protein